MSASPHPAPAGGTTATAASKFEIKDLTLPAIIVGTILVVLIVWILVAPDDFYYKVDQIEAGLLKILHLALCLLAIAFIGVCIRYIVPISKAIGAKLSGGHHHP